MNKFKTLVADPPWKYNNIRTGGAMNSGSAQKYPVMDLEDICNLPIKDIMDKDSVCFLWCTVPLIQYGFKVLESWGYQYKTMIIWRKIMSWGMGFWFRGQVELCLLGIRGKVKPFRYQKANFIQCKVGKHSEKPDDFYTLIKPVSTEPRLELFASKDRDGWTCVGFEANGQDVKDFLNASKEN